MFFLNREHRAGQCHEFEGTQLAALVLKQRLAVFSAEHSAEIRPVEHGRRSYRNGKQGICGCSRCRGDHQYQEEEQTDHWHIYLSSV